MRDQAHVRLAERHGRTGRKEQGNWTSGFEDRLRYRRTATHRRARLSRRLIDSPEPGIYKRWSTGRVGSAGGVMRNRAREPAVGKFLWDFLFSARSVFVRRVG